MGRDQYQGLQEALDSCWSPGRQTVVPWGRDSFVHVCPHLCRYACICVHIHLHTYFSLFWLRNLGRIRIQDQLLAFVHKADCCRDPHGVHVCMYAGMCKRVQTCPHAHVPSTGKTEIQLGGGRHIIPMQLYFQQSASILLTQRREQDEAGFKPFSPCKFLQFCFYMETQTPYRLYIGL